VLISRQLKQLEVPLPAKKDNTTRYGNGLNNKNCFMYLGKFNIKNFRTIENLTLTFNRGLNILIGENNSGKTAIIDALRICIGYGNLRRDLYVKDSDFHLQRNSITDASTEIEFHLYFKIENPQEKGWFIDLLNAYEGGGEDLQILSRPEKSLQVNI